MYIRVFSAATLVAFLGATSVLAQTVSSVGGPAELPPAGFKGQQYVDSRGCVYLKAGLSGQVNWVLRVGGDRKPMCNQTPTFAAKQRIEIATAEEAAAPPPDMAEMAEAAPVMQAPAPKAAAKPFQMAPRPTFAASAPLVMPGIAKAMEAPAPTDRPRASNGYEVASNGLGNGKIGCFASAPVAEQVKLRNGGTAIVCTRGDGTLNGWRSPIYASGARVGASLSDPPVGFVRGGSQGSQGHSVGQSGDIEGGFVAENNAPQVPKGYKLAWDDDRLNPMRGKGTAQGWADQDQVWTRDVPAEAVTTTKRVKRRVVGSASAPEQATVRQTVSTKSVGGGGQSYIQVGTFGVASNADGAAGRLQALGLPVARANTSKGLQIVMAGPFASAADAQSVLSAVRGAGFGDAFVK